MGLVVPTWVLLLQSWVRVRHPQSTVSWPPAPSSSSQRLAWCEGRPAFLCHRAGEGIRSHSELICNVNILVARPLLGAGCHGEAP